MGQTLENGVYLPSEGERNCYAGLKTNWEILDQKVADVTALQQAVAGALHREIVESLPTTDIDPNTIYMILSGTSATENVYNEYMYVNNAWELIGTSATDLTNYYTKSEVDGKLLLKASASDLTSHTGDTTIHVTTADKNKWNNNTYVFRYSSTALVASSTNSNTLLDNTDNLKVGDKVIDSDGVLFSVTAIDTANSTFTIGTALVDLALDANVVHTSGNETVGGQKTFSDNLTIYNSDDTQTPKGLTIRNAQWGMGESGGITVSSINFLDKNSAIPASIIASKGISGQSFLRFSVRTKDSQNNALGEEIYYDIDTSGNIEFRSWHDNSVSLGTSAYRWKGVYAQSYYYGSNNVEFSTKFVTTDTVQTITHPKTFTYPPSFTGYPSIRLYSPTDDVNVLPSSVQQREIRFTDKNNATIAYFGFQHRASSDEPFRTCWRQQKVDGTSSYYSVNFNNLGEFYPEINNPIKLGTSTNRWADCQTYQINGLTPSSLGMPSNTGYVDISSYFTNTGDGQTNSYTASANGWIYLNVVATKLIMQIRDSNNNVVYADMCNRSSDGTIYMTIPIGSGNKLLTQWFTSSSVTVTTARFIPCQGNV